MDKNNMLKDVLNDYRNIISVNTLSHIFKKWDEDGVPDKAGVEGNKIYYDGVYIANLVERLKDKRHEAEYMKELSYSIKVDDKNIQSILYIAKDNLKRFLISDNNLNVDVYVLEREPEEAGESLTQLLYRLKFSVNTMYIIISLSLQLESIKDKIVSIYGKCDLSFMRDIKVIPYNDSKFVGNNNIRTFGYIPYIKGMYDISRSGKTIDILKHILTLASDIFKDGSVDKYLENISKFKGDDIYTRNLDIMKPIITHDAPTVYINKHELDDVIIALSPLVKRDKLPILYEDFVQHYSNSDLLPEAIKVLASGALSTKKYKKMLNTVRAYEDKLLKSIRKLNIEEDKEYDNCESRVSPFFPEVIGNHTYTLNVYYDSLTYDINKSNGKGYKIKDHTFMMVKNYNDEVSYITNTGKVFTNETLGSVLNFTPYTHRTINGSNIFNYSEKDGTVMVESSDYGIERKSIDNIEVLDPCQLNGKKSKMIAQSKILNVIASYIKSKM